MRTMAGLLLAALLLCAIATLYYREDILRVQRNYQAYSMRSLLAETTK